MTRHLTTFVLICLLGLAPALAPAAPARDRAEALRAFQRQSAGVSYQFGSCTRSQMDCSCFIQRLFAEEFGEFLPRTTLAQASWMADKRVTPISRPSQLTDRNLCAGDLIYTYALGSSWPTGPRHVVVYAGGDRVLHSSPAIRGVGTSPLAWVRRYHLHGVFRPLGCDGDRRRTPAPARARTDRATAVGATDRIRAVIDSLFETWETQDLDRFRSCWSPKAVQWDLGRRRDLNEIVRQRRKSFRTLVAARETHRYEEITAWTDHAIVEVVYSLEMKFSQHTYHQQDLKESFTLRRDNGTWRIIHNESYQGN